MPIETTTSTTYTCPCGTTRTIAEHDSQGASEVKREWAWCKVSDLMARDHHTQVQLLCPACVRVVALVLHGRRAQEASAMVFDGIPQKPNT